MNIVLQNPGYLDFGVESANRVYLQLIDKQLISQCYSDRS